MTEKHLHIISFDIPHPPSYGGVVDVFFKLKAFAETGIKIHLHCFEYGRAHSAPLKELCYEVRYYPRRKSPFLLAGKTPFIIRSRSSKELVRNLLKDEYPILMEGLHSCAYLSLPQFRNRKILVRAHNIEHDYYRGLASAEKNFFKRWYFHREAAKLEKFEPALRYASAIAAISEKDAKNLSAKYSRVHWVAPFHPDEQISARTGAGSFALYHANLAVNENNQAALYLVQQVFHTLEYPLVIAGNNPSPELQRAAGKHPHIELKANITTEEIYKLIRDAQMNVLPTFQPTGLKLKLLAALHQGRHCIVNSPMVDGTGLESLCHITDSPGTMKETILRLSKRDFDSGEIKRRTDQLGDTFSNRKNIQKLIGLLFP